MDDTSYIEKQKELQDEFEALCLWCGACCGAGNEPCANLIGSGNGKYLCKEYDNRLSQQKTVSGRAFTCVSIRSLIKTGLPYPECGYNDRR